MSNYIPSQDFTIFIGKSNKILLCMDEQSGNVSVGSSNNTYGLDVSTNLFVANGATIVDALNCGSLSCGSYSKPNDTSATQSNISSTNFYKSTNGIIYGTINFTAGTSYTAGTNKYFTATHSLGTSNYILLTTLKASFGGLVLFTNMLSSSSFQIGMYNNTPSTYVSGANDSINYQIILSS